jgi:hypothetical protein
LSQLRKQLLGSLISYRAIRTCYLDSLDPLVDRRVELPGNCDNFSRFSQIESLTSTWNLNKVKVLKKVENSNEVVVNLAKFFFVVETLCNSALKIMPALLGWAN